MASKSHKRAHEYAAAQNVSAWTLHHDGHCVGRIITVFQYGGCVASLYRYTHPENVWGISDVDMAEAGSHVVTARGTYANETLEAVVREGLRGRGVHTTYHEDDPWHGRMWRDILEGHGIHPYGAI